MPLFDPAFRLPLQLELEIVVLIHRDDVAAAATCSDLQPAVIHLPALVREGVFFVSPPGSMRSSIEQADPSILRIAS